MLTNLDERQSTKNAKMTFNNQSFLLNGKSYFIASGEIHYFRIDSRYWPIHLKLLKEAGLNTVSTYIPWSLHEQIEGEPDFYGLYGANLDLERFIGLCRDMQVNLVVKPGPYILAELSMHGIPRWFFERYPEALARDASGKTYAARYTSLNHPDFRRKVMGWYDAIMGLLSSNQITKGGPIVLMQVCNEVGLFQWLGGAGDYGEASLQDYRRYLQLSYGSLKEFNSRYNTEYSEWRHIRPPCGTAASSADRIGYQDWQTYHRYFYADYIRWLIEEIRRRDIEIPLFHNVPGWVFGRAKEMPVCLSMYHELSRLYPDVLLGMDHIPENPSYRNFHDDRIINLFAKALQNGCGPTYIAELQVGTREAAVNVYPSEMELFYKACLANGAVSMNFYMFSQGKNPAGWGIYDSEFYLQTPLDHEGRPGDFYSIVRQIGTLVQTHGAHLCQATSSANQALVFYPPYYYRELTRPLFTKENLTPLQGADARFDPQTITDELLFDGLGKLLAMDNQEYDAVDITRCDTKSLRRYKQLWLASTDRMDADSQRKLLEYVKDGGHLICFPGLPRKDLQASPCALLADGLGVQTEQILEDTDGMIYWTLTGEEIHALPSIETLKAEAAQVIARTKDGLPCGLRVTCGKGSACVLGTGFLYQAAAHRNTWQKLGLQENFRGPIQCDDPLIITRTRRNGESGYFFMLNYHNQSQQTKIVQGLPLACGASFHLPPFSGLMLSFNLAIGDGSIMRFSTSEIVKIEIYQRKLILQLSGHPQTDGYMALEFDRTVEDILLDKEKVKWKKEGQNILLNYRHTFSLRQLEILFKQNLLNGARI